MTTVMGSFPPGLILLAGVPLLFVVPLRARPAAFLVFPALALALLPTLELGARLVIPFLSYELVVGRIDRLSLAFGYVFSLVTLLGGIYSFHLKDTGQQVSTLLYAGSAMGVVFAGDLLTLFVFWEIMAVSSAGLIWARRTPQSYRAGMRYLFVHLFGGSVLLAGILWHQAETGSLAFDHLEGGPGAYLILLAFAINAAIPVLHAWLPDGYGEATITGSVFLSAFTTKTAVYVLARGFAGWDILLWAGPVMALYGVMFAVLENDIRRLLAYHIISQVGYMVTAVGLGTEAAINGATAHAFAHILYKALLFMGAGTVLHATGSSKLTELGGLARTMPLTFSLYMIGALSISGFPLLSGFVSKSMVIYAAELSHLEIIVLILTLASVGTFLHTGLKLPYFTWFGPSRSLRPTAPPRCMYVGMALIAAANVVIGVHPALLYNILPFPTDYQPFTAPHVLETAQVLAFTALGFWLLLNKLGGEPTITMDTDWFYRKPSRLAHRLAVVSLRSLFVYVENLALYLARFLFRLSANPLAYLALATGFRIQPQGGEKRDTSAAAGNLGNQYELPLGGIVLLMVLCFVLIVWILFRL